eukprot:1393561-Amorphochlora_amoeboformis.AAC.1
MEANKSNLHNPSRLGADKLLKDVLKDYSACLSPRTIDSSTGWGYLVVRERARVGIGLGLGLGLGLQLDYC